MHLNLCICQHKNKYKKFTYDNAHWLGIVIVIQWVFFVLFYFRHYRCDDSDRGIIVVMILGIVVVMITIPSGDCQRRTGGARS